MRGNDQAEKDPAIRETDAWYHAVTWANGQLCLEFLLGAEVKQAFNLEKKDHRNT